MKQTHQWYHFLAGYKPTKIGRALFIGRDAATALAEAHPRMATDFSSQFLAQVSVQGSRCSRRLLFVCMGWTRAPVLDGWVQVFSALRPKATQWPLHDRSEFTTKIRELQNENHCMNDSKDSKDVRSVRSGPPHVANQPVFFTLQPNPGGMLSRSLGMPRRKAAKMGRQVFGTHMEYRETCKSNRTTHHHM